MKSQMMTKGNFKSIFKQITAMLISICIIGQGSSAFAMQSPKQQREEFIDYLKEEQDRYKTLFDQEALLEALDYDTDNIIDFVTNKVVYQAYDGVLRGAKGTLVGRAGNSHDQAITLAGMLNDAGLEAEILVSKLTAEQATELNLTIASPKFSELKNTITTSKSIIAKKISAKFEEIANIDAESASSIMEETNELAERIFKQLPEEQIKKGMETFKKNVQNSAISYRWVRYRLAKGKKWIEIHPAYAGGKKWNLTPESVETNTVNPDDLQQLSVEVWIENTAGEKHSISGLWKKPVANLLDHTLSIEVGSDAMMEKELTQNPEEIFKQSHFFFIQVDGKLPKEGKVFDLRGNIYSSDSLSGLNSVFSTINKKSQDAVDALSDLSINKNNPEENNKKQLTKVWLEFTIEKSNRESRQIKRVIFDKKELDANDRTAMRLLQRWDIDISSTTPMQQFYQHKKSQQVIGIFEGLQNFQAYFKNKPNAKAKEVIEKYITALGNTNAGALTHKRSIFDSYKSQEKIVSYLSEPNVLAVRRGFNLSDTGFSIYEMTDIIANQRLSLENNVETLSPMLVAGIKHGVWETRTEGARTLRAQNTIYADSAFEQLEQLNGYREQMSDQAMNLFNESGSAWWDIDLSTGSTIGMIESEQGIGGSAFTEYLIKQISITSFLSGIFFIVSTTVCINGGGSIKCCFIFNGIITGIGFGLSLLFGALAMKGVAVAAFKAGSVTAGGGAIISTAGPKAIGSIVSVAADIGLTVVASPCTPDK